MVVPIVLAAFTGAQPAPAAPPAAERELVPGQRIEARLAETDEHAYVLSLEAGQFLRLAAVQDGTDVTVTVVTAAGERVETNVAQGEFGAEPVSILAPAAGACRVFVKRTKRADGGGGGYALVSEPVRAATEDDRARFAAERTLAEGAAQLGREQPAAALETLAAALPLWRQTGDREGEARVLQLAGLAHFAQYDYHLAIGSLQQALELQRTLGDRRAQAEILRHAGQAHDRMGDTQARRRAAREMLDIQRQLGDRRAEAEALNEVGGAYGNSGSLQEALDLFRQAAVIFSELGDRPAEASALNNVGVVLDELGDPAGALSAFERTQALWRALGDRLREAGVDINIAAAHSSLGDSQKALALYRRVLEVQRQGGPATRYGQAGTLNNLGHELNVVGSHAEARTLLEEALGMALEMSSTGHEAAIRVNLGTACAGLGQAGEARQHYDRALAIARARDDRSREAKVLARMAELARDTGELDQALTLAEATIDTLETMRRGLNSIGLRSSFVASVHHAYELYVDVLMALHRQRPAGGFDARALRASELARARALLDSLGEAQAQITKGVDRSLVEREQELQDRLSAAVDRHMRLTGSGAAESRTRAAAEDVQSLRSEWDAVKGRLRASSPSYAALKEPEPLTAAEIQQAVLDEETVLLEYALGKNRSFLWVVAKGGLASHDLPARAVIEEAARAAYERLARSGARPAGATGADDALLRLSRMVLGPAAAALGAKRLLVVPDGALHYIPFAALPDPGAGGAPLVARHEIVAAPSASTIAVLRRDDRLDHGSKAVAVLADPVFGPDDERIPRAARAQAPRTPRLLADGRDVLRDVGDADLARLPFTGREARAILRLVKPHDGKAALGFDASREAALDPSLAEFRIVHFATHGFFNAANPELSGIVLSLHDRAGRETRGFLSVADVFNMHLRAQLVVLSGCRTALGREIHGEGLVGLSRGFMYAGAQRVLASSWRVDDAATAELMTHFYRAVLVRGLPPAAALRYAQRSLMRKARFRDPYYWAGFQLQGEWR